MRVSACSTNDTQPVISNLPWMNNHVPSIPYNPVLEKSLLCQIKHCSACGVDIHVCASLLVVGGTANCGSFFTHDDMSYGLDVDVICHDKIVLDVSGLELFGLINEMGKAIACYCCLTCFLTAAAHDQKHAQCWKYQIKYIARSLEFKCILSLATAFVSLTMEAHCGLIVTDSISRRTLLSGYKTCDMQRFCSF